MPAVKVCIGQFIVHSGQSTLSILYRFKYLTFIDLGIIHPVQKIVTTCVYYQKEQYKEYIIFFHDS